MTKQAGMGLAYYLAGNDISGDIQGFTKITGGPLTINTTDITQSGMARLGGQRDGGIDLTAYWDPVTSHPVLSALPATDVIETIFVNPLAIGSPSVSCVAKQVTYDGSRDSKDGYLFTVSTLPDAYGIEWGLQLTAGKRTDVAAANGTSNNDGASTAFGAQAYLQVFAFTGTDATVKIQDSADNAAWADVAGFAFAQVTTAPQAQRITIANNATLRQYVRAATVTTGGFSSLVFAVQYTRNLLAGQVF